MSSEETALPAVHDAIKPLSWLLGKWKSTQASGKYPTIKDFSYTEELEFSHVGQPILEYKLSSFNATTGAPMHREHGFLRMKPGTNEVALFSAHNMGLAGMEEGLVKNDEHENELTVETTSLGRMSFGSAPAVKRIKRQLTRTGDKLEQIMYMETANTDLTEHLRAIYEKIA